MGGCFEFLVSRRVLLESETVASHVKDTWLEVGTRADARRLRGRNFLFACKAIIP